VHERNDVSRLFTVADKTLRAIGDCILTTDHVRVSTELSKIDTLLVRQRICLGSYNEMSVAVACDEIVGSVRLSRTSVRINVEILAIFHSKNPYKE